MDLMNTFEVAFMKLNSVIMPLAQAGGDSNTTNATMANLVSIVATIAGALVAIFLIYSIAKDSFAYVKGSGDASIAKIITKVVFLALCIALIFIAKGWESLGNTFSGVANKGIDSIEKIGNDILP